MARSVIIRRSPIADSRTCDYKSVTKQQLADASAQHIQDVQNVMALVRHTLKDIAEVHDGDKLQGIDEFYSNFLTDFEEKSWLRRHYASNRHHLSEPEGVPGDVDLLDVMEHVVDCVAAGLARKGEVYPIDLPDALLQKAVANTVTMLKQHIAVEGRDADGNGEDSG